MNNSVEYILCAAYKRKIPKVEDKLRSNYKDVSKWESHGKYDDIYNIEIGRRHNDILTRFPNELDQFQSGFYTSHGRFVDRYEGLQIALLSGQVTRDKLSAGSDSDQLFSEDLY